MWKYEKKAITNALSKDVSVIPRSLREMNNWWGAFLKTKKLFLSRELMELESYFRRYSDSVRFQFIGSLAVVCLMTRHYAGPVPGEDAGRGASGCADVTWLYRAAALKVSHWAGAGAHQQLRRRRPQQPRSRNA